MVRQHLQKKAISIPEKEVQVLEPTPVTPKKQEVESHAKLLKPAESVVSTEDEPSDIELPEMFEYEGLWFQVDNQPLGRDELN
jgi:hypothetical protein